MPQNPNLESRRLSRLGALHQKNFSRRLGGTILDFGCGAGGMLLAGLEEGYDIHGVEVADARDASYQSRVNRLDAARRADALSRFQLYDGVDLPFPGRSFDAVISWFVFEHVPDTFGSLRQIARVLKPGGTLMLFAEEARNGWEGHPQIPWPPFMPRRFTRAYLDEFGLEDRAEFINETCFYVTAPMIASALEAFGLEVVGQNVPPPPVFPETVDIMTNDDARAAARIAKARLAAGIWTAPAQNLEIYAVKSRFE